MLSPQDLAAAAIEACGHGTIVSVAVNAVDKALNDSGYARVVTGPDRLKIARTVVLALGENPDAKFGAEDGPDA